MSVAGGLVIADKYVLLRRLGRGGMAEVYLAKQVGKGGFEKLVVLKRTLPRYQGDPRFSAMFLEEARVAADLRHPNVVELFELGEDKGALYIVMEFLHGQDVAEILDRHRLREDRLPIGHAVHIIIDAAAGLHYVHSKHDLDGAPMNLIHRDVSPQNVVVTYDGETKVVDFGIAKALGRAFQTRVGAVKGKACYMSPEQVRGEVLDHRTDQFALGIVLYELLTGRRLFRNSSDVELFEAVVKADIPPLAGVVPGVDETLEKIVCKALAADRDARFSDCNALGLALEDYLDGQGITHGERRLQRYLRRFFADEIEDDRALGHARLSLQPTPAEPEDVTREFGTSRPAQDPPTSDVPGERSSVASSEPSFSPPGFGDDEEGERTMTGAAITAGNVGTAEEPFRSDAQTLLHSDEDHAPANHNIVREDGAFIGREDALLQLQSAFDTGGTRLVTVIGPGGVGKSRLALEYAHRHLGDYLRTGGVWHCDLSSARTAGEIIATVARVLGIARDGLATLAARSEHVGSALKRRGRTLLVLDPFEHLTAFFEHTLQVWLTEAPGLRLLLTSERPLRLPGESAFELAPVPTPALDADTNAVLAAPAVRILIDSAKEHDATFDPAEEEVPYLARIARALEGSPLALQIAAARLAERPASSVLAELSQPGATVGLDETIRWSWSLLLDDERSALAQLSIFVGGFDLKAAEAVLRLPQSASAARMIDRLRDRSLLTATEPRGLRGELRFVVTRPVHEFGRARLAERDDAEEVAERHARYYIARCSDLGRTIDGPGGVRVLLRLSLEQQNLLAVAARSLAADRSTAAAERALTALLVADAPLVASGDPDHAQRLTLAIDAAIDTAADVSLIARALEQRADAKQRQGDAQSAEGDLGGALSLARAHGDLWFEAVVLRNLSEVREDPAEAARDARAALDLFRRLGDRQMEARVLLSMARRRREQGDLERASELANEALTIFRHVGDRRFEGRAIGELARTAVARGKADGARALYGAALSIHREMGEPRRGGEMLVELSRVYDKVGDARAARGCLERARKLFLRLGQEEQAERTERALEKLRFPALRG